VLRAEPIPLDEVSPAEGDSIVYVSHIAAPKQPPSSQSGSEPDAANTGGSADGLIGTVGGPVNSPAAAAVPFGDPFLLRIGQGETVAQVKARIQEKLGVAAAEFESWKVAFVSTRTAPQSVPQYLAGNGKGVCRKGAASCGKHFFRW
jgi:hypothetical protein